MTTIKQALTIAGSDSGGGAGIQADLKTFQMRHVYGMSVITAVTAQNTLGVHDIHLIPTQTIAAQIDAIYQDFTPNAVKIGMLGNADIIECIAQKLQQQHQPNLVVDPVMIAKGGANLLEQQAIDTLRNQLLPIAEVLTPNIPEAEALSGVRITDIDSIQHAARMIQEMGTKIVIIKGGHQTHTTHTTCIDWVFTPDEIFTLTSPRFNTPHTHGTGCTFSACLTAELAKGVSFKTACHTAKRFITDAIQHSLNIGHGHGPTNHWAYTE